MKRSIKIVLLAAFPVASALADPCPEVPVRIATINVKAHCCAQGNGKDDDTLAIQRCLKQAPGKTLEFPSGTYPIREPLNIPKGTLIQREAYSPPSHAKKEKKSVDQPPPPPEIIQKTAGAAVFVIHSPGVTVQGLRLTLPPASTGFEISGTAQQNAYTLNIRENVIGRNDDAFGEGQFRTQGFPTGIRIADFTSGVGIRGNKMSGLGFGILVQIYGKSDPDITAFAGGWTGNSGRPAKLWPNQVVISENIIRDSYSNAIEVNSPIGFGEKTPASDFSVSHVTVQNNMLSSPNGSGDPTKTGTCIGIVGAQWVALISNHLQLCRWNGIRIEDFTSHVTVSDNEIGDSKDKNRPATLGPDKDHTGWPQANSSGIWLEATDDCSISGNTFAGTAGPAIQMINQNISYDYRPQQRGNGTISLKNSAIHVGKNIFLRVAGENIDSR